MAGVKYNNTTYFYCKDAQRNIIAILDNNGAVVVNYIYDAWGNNAVIDNNGNDLTSGIGVLNPFRYRGYYYDTETELCYLQTRYYKVEYIMEEDTMKRFRWTCFAILSFSLTLVLAMSLTACVDRMYQNRMVDYYSDDNNYVELTGNVIERIKNGDEYTNVLTIKITSSDDDFYMYGSDTGDFCLYFKQEVLDGILEGDTIIFKSAPRIFYDGQKYPIVSLNKEGQELISFTEGKSNYIEWIKREFS